MHCNDAIRGQFRHGLGQIDQGGDVAEGIRIGFLQRKKARGEGTLGQGGGGLLGPWGGWAVTSEAAWAGGAVEPEGQGATESANLWVVSGGKGTGGNSSLQLEARVQALGTSSNGRVCHPLIVAIHTKLDTYRVMCIWSLGEAQVFPVQSQRISQE
jgi:hypothetical protein